MNIGLLLLRVVIGALLFGHGAQKMYGWFGGHGLDATAGMFGSLGFRPARAYAWIAAFVELAAGILLVLGFLMPLAAAMIIGQMLVAGWVVHRGAGLWNTQGGYEYPLVLATIGTTLGFTGAGRFSFDTLLDIDLSHDVWGFVALILGVTTGALVMSTREPARTELLRHQ